jgi:hypothetical protein
MSQAMPRYYFDVVDAQGTERDDVGQVLPNLQAARKESLRALIDIAREQFGSGRSATLQINVRTDDNIAVSSDCLQLTRTAIQ